MLAGLLRATETLPVREALDAESLAYSTLLGGAEFARWLTARGARPEPPAVEDPVLVTRSHGRLRITLNRPERRNAYGRQVRDVLVEALQFAVLDDTVIRVVLTGAGPVFCSGGDLDEFGTTPDLAIAHLVRTRAGAGRLIAEIADRVEVRVHGACVGAGIELPAFAGTVVAAPSATFRLPEVGMGLIPGAGGTVSIPAASAAGAPSTSRSPGSRSTPQPRLNGDCSGAAGDQQLHGDELVAVAGARAPRDRRHARQPDLPRHADPLPEAADRERGERLLLDQAAARRPRRRARQDAVFAEQPIEVFRRNIWVSPFWSA
ncbi:enoyl-CoA hydratase/isomerase family protein [Pseudonocardia sp. H11422]|uniref:enoyl-CoA hydratase/isomerase family protein n=1 Tax=Pseudonocardia sp. H11422 TaxID=2835866 RepID=UPI0027E27283|nr:enoyl-CoA hydratase/isomerase family protein [Pseudonocardia sp. H11422]